MKLHLLLASAAIALALPGAASAGVIETDYTFNNNPWEMQAENTYAIVTHSDEYRGDTAWGDYTAPNGTSTFYIFNGGKQTDPLLRLFYEDGVSLTAGQTYSYSILAVNNYDYSPPVLQLEVDGALVGNSVTLGGPFGHDYTGVPGPWQEETFIFKATTTETAVVALVDTNTEWNGNDFSISAVPEASTWAMMLLGFAGFGALSYRRARTAARTLTA